jgi:hypothetical protein
MILIENRRIPIIRIPKAFHSFSTYFLLRCNFIALGFPCNKLMINSAKLKTNKNLRERKIPSSGRKAPITKKMTAKYRLAAEDTTSRGMASGSREKKYGIIRFALDNSIIKVVSKEHSRFAIFLKVFLLVFIGNVILLRNVLATVYLGILIFPILF